jgi:LysM repeat protein
MVATMSIKVQLKNVAKLLLIGVILLSASLVFSATTGKGKTSANDQICIENSQNAYLDASKQTRLESPDFLLVDDSCVRASTPPITVSTKVLGSLVGGDEYYQENMNLEDDQRAVLEYIVEQGDTVALVAEKFGVSADTILWANDLSGSAQIKAGQQLIILPVTGIIHNVVNGDTVSAMAQKYQVKTDDIVAFNKLSGEADVYIGDSLIIPGGKMPKIAAKPKTGSTAKPSTGLASGLSLPGDYFTCPIGPSCRKTQGSHYNNAVDLSNGQCGDNIYAAASGVVQRAAYGWNKGAGNYITIIHPSGSVTKYFHLQTIFVKPGQPVFKGQSIIGLMGTTGLSTGCHLHFEVIGAANPFR